MLMAEQILFFFFPLHLAHCSFVMTNLMNELISNIRNRDNLVQNGAENGGEIKFNHLFFSAMEI